MDEFSHLFPEQTASRTAYTYPRDGGSGEFLVPPRDDRVRHGQQLVQQLLEASRVFQEQAERTPWEQRPKGVALDFESDPGFKLKLESLESRRSGIELRNSRMVGDVMHGTVFVPEGNVGVFVRKFEAYASKNSLFGKPQNKDLAESITRVRLVALKSFWTDAGEFPTDTSKSFWWEVWLAEDTGAGDIAATFCSRAAAVQIQVSEYKIRFPERCVRLARATVQQWSAFENLFDMLAELRLAKTLASEFTALSPRDQGEFIQEALNRIQPPPTIAPSVCHLDTGINWGHPLLAPALAEDRCLAIMPDWSPADRDGHGTAMAGLSLYGDLAKVLEDGEPVELRHGLESVKIFRWDRPHDPELYGEVTAQAAARIEIAAPKQDRRVLCLTVTADGRDQGYPSSWSARVDEICAGIEDNERATPPRLLLVAAGNVPAVGRHRYPDFNHIQGLHDPAQSWNALAVGAYTEKAVIHSVEYEKWKPIAPPGGLSPASATSMVWEDKSWALKPDIVMEGGNNAINPATGDGEDVDDLMLLTTDVSPDGRLLTTTGDTSGATALAARYAAIIWSHYPQLWPETVRALLVHSARWTKRMLDEFPREQRHNRLRCYGHGVPDLRRALRSLSNSATLIVQETLQPYEKVVERDKKGQRKVSIKTKDMHLHRLPWPTQVLQDLGETEVRMRVTLSYFIEPSPGRRGWNRKHRYQSHGLRFDVKRPTDADEVFFLKRISKAAREEDEEFVGEKDEREWEIGPQTRPKGSLHSDTWTGTAADLAHCGVIAVCPVSGWWRERGHLDCWDRQARYSLIVTLETPATDVYMPIAAQITVPTSVEIGTE
jgi:hypothetical protein